MQQRASAVAARQDEAPQRRQLGLEPIDPVFETLDVGVVDGNFGHALRDFFSRVGEPGADGEQVVLDVLEHLRHVAGSSPCARTAPRQAFSSSTSPYAATRGSAFDTRVPPNSAVPPASPVRV